MKCDRIKKLLNAYIDNELSEKDTKRVKMHLQECIDCAEEVAELDKVQQMIHELPKLKAPVELVEKVRQRITGIKQPEVSIFWRYSWLAGSFASAAAVFLLVYIVIINSYHGDYSVKESVLKEQARPERLSLDSEAPAFRASSMNIGGFEPAKDGPRPSDSSTAALSQNIQITTDDINETTDKIYEVANVARSGFLAQAPVLKEGLAKSGEPHSGDRSEKKAREELTKGKLQESAPLTGRASENQSRQGPSLKATQKAESEAAALGQGDSAERTITQSRLDSPGKQYIVKVIVPLSRKDAFIRNLKSNISGELTISQMQVASMGKLMITKRLADDIAKEENKELLSVQAAEDKSDNQELRRKQEMNKDSNALQPKTKPVTEEGAPGLVTKPPAQPATPAPTQPSPTPLPPPPSSSPMSPPSNPSAPSYSGAKDGISAPGRDQADADKKNLEKGKALPEAKAPETEDKGDTLIGKQAGSREESSEKLDALQDIADEIMIEFTIVIEEKTK